MADRSHLSIGEVLSLLQGEFPDVTISKIRFLESQGLLDPERTPSGYRKFYEADIERLRWILHQQRDNFLPLKVIKDRLDEADRAGLVVPAEPEQPEAPAPVDAPEPAMAPAAPAVATAAPEPEPEAEPAIASAAEAAPAPTRPPAAARPGARTQPAATPLDAGPSTVSLTLDELASACGLARDDLVELERFGLLVGHPVGAETYYDGDALVIARTAAGFLRYGIEARHLRMYKVAAEREAGFFEQVVMPLLKQRNPTARQQAADTLGDLSSLGESLRAALLRAALGEHR
jgi:DNA-binding transcriptional MerR regulator